MNNPFILTFGVDIDRFYRKELKIDQQGLCQFYLQSNIDHPELSTLGHFQTEISQKMAMQIYQRVLALADEALPDRGVLPSGIPLYEVTLEQDGKKRSRRFDPYVIPERFQLIGRNLAAIEAKALETPHAALQMQALLTADTIQREQPLGVRVELTHAGTAPVSILNPLLTGEQKTGRLQLTGVRSDIPEDELETVHRKAAELELGHLVAKDPSLANPVLAFDPERMPRIEFNLSVPIDWAPGDYVLKVVLELPASTNKPEIIAVRFTSQSMALTVTGEVKASDYPEVEYTPPIL